MTGGQLPPRPTGQVRALGAAVEAWGSDGGTTCRRPGLPWRSTRDPWAVLVSEVMAQQTQVSRVVPAYRRFLVAFPTPAACAAAPLGDVLRAWEGMGYNRRGSRPAARRRLGRRRPRWRGPGLPGGVAVSAGGRPLHRQGCPRFRLRARRGGRGHQRRTRPRPGGGGASAPARRGPGAGRLHGPAGTGLVVRAVPARPRGDGVHAACAVVWLVPGTAAMPVGRRRAARPGSCGEVGRRPDPAGPVRRLGPSGPGTVGGRPAHRSPP